jgi:hypothetical protein
MTGAKSPHPLSACMSSIGTSLLYFTLLYFIGDSQFHNVLILAGVAAKFDKVRIDQVP